MCTFLAFSFLKSTFKKYTTQRPMGHIGYDTVHKIQWRSHWGGKKGQRATLDSEKFAKNREKEGKNQEKSGKKEEKSGRKGKNREGSFTLPLLTDRAYYATDKIAHEMKRHLHNQLKIGISWFYSSLNHNAEKDRCHYSSCKKPFYS